MQMRDGLDGGVSDGAAVLSSSVFRAGLEELEIAFENILDTQKHVPKSGALHQRRQRPTMLGERRRHRLNEILDVVEPGVDDRMAQRFEPMYVESNVVVDQKDRACAQASRIRDVGEHSLDWIHMEITSAHFDD